MQVLIIGSGIAGLSAAIRSAELGCHVILASPYVSERAQSVMAAGGINAVLDPSREGDSIELHIEDTMKGGCFIEDEDAVRGLCTAAPDIVRWLDSIGVMFSRDPSGKIAQRAFGGQSRDRTAYAGASTGRQIVTALIQKCREYEIGGKIERRIGLNFHSAVIHGGRCCGAVFTETVSGRIVTLPADAVIIAAGGMNRLFGSPLNRQELEALGLEDELFPLEGLPDVLCQCLLFRAYAPRPVFHLLQVFLHRRRDRRPGRRAECCLRFR